MCMPCIYSLILMEHVMYNCHEIHSYAHTQARDSPTGLSGHAIVFDSCSLFVYLLQRSWPLSVCLYDSVVPRRLILFAAWLDLHLQCVYGVHACVWAVYVRRTHTVTFIIGLMIALRPC